MQLRTLPSVIFILHLVSVLAFGEKREVAVAAAANLSDVFQSVGAAFEKETGIHPVFSFGSTAALTRQVENGAPWDLIAGADTEHIEELDAKGLLSKGSRRVYATGVLILWLPSADSMVRKPEDLAGPSVRVIALAKPELAPYGRAAKDTLEHLGIWARVGPKVVYAENISMAKQYGATGNADAVFTALSLIKPSDGGRAVTIPEALHQPIRQALGVIAGSKNQAPARQFAEFLLTGRGHEILLRSGYR